MRYAQIRKLDISNGENIGVALFVQGCHFHCKNCFNPETWDFNGGKEWMEEVKNKFLELVDRPYIKRVSILGGEPLAEENINDVLNLVTEINKRYNTPQDKAYVTDKNNNILASFPDKIRLSKLQKSIWLYTGYEFNEIFGENQFEDLDNGYCKWTKRADIVSRCNILVDGQYIDSQRDLTLPYRGSKNQRLIDIQQSLQKGEIVLWKD